MFNTQTNGMQLELYNYKNSWKFVLLVVAVLIALGTLWYTESFLKELRKEEANRAQIWAEATKILVNAETDEQFLLALLVAEKNTTIPIIMIDQDSNIVLDRNIKLPKKNQDAFLKELVQTMAKESEPIIVELPNNTKNYIFYRDSSILTQLRIYPIVLLGVIALFIMIAYMAFSNVRRSEQNRVWTGMAKETAHQIGTPLSSLMGWIALLREQNTDETALEEMEKDIDRLQTITDRFSKIGSQPQLQLENIAEATEKTTGYMKRRSSKRIEMSYKNLLAHPIILPLNIQLYGWVIENLVKNAIDAIEGKGQINVLLSENSSNVIIEVSDTGKGISPAQTKTIFRPGFTTKSRGWGLGLSLAKRIIEDYHKGKISVAKSEIGKGTTFRITLPKN